MQKKIISLGLFLFISSSLISGTINQQEFGINIMSGTRYDDLRMCVASEAGAKGGPIADIMLLSKHKINNNSSLLFKLPIFRPILFAAAFQMLQFEPELAWLKHYSITNSLSFSYYPSIGLSLNYGPDYKSDLENRRDSFFSTGPFFAFFTGLSFGKNKNNTVGLKFFYIPLFSKNQGSGKVIGASLEYSYFFNN